MPINSVSTATQPADVAIASIFSSLASVKLGSEWYAYVKSAGVRRKATRPMGEAAGSA
jgi:hypothetical protein